MKNYFTLLKKTLRNYRKLYFSTDNIIYVYEKYFFYIF